MPSIDTKQFGTLHFTEDDVFEFPNGLPGFDAARRFLCIERPAYRPIVFLQSVEDAGLCFITLPARAVDPAYQLEVAPEERTILGLASAMAPEWEQSLACLAIVCLPPDGAPTANLLGPVVLSRETHKGIQSVRDDRRYSALTPLESAFAPDSSDPAVNAEPAAQRLAEV
jgi:flagellar assembly factor FliW